MKRKLPVLIAVVLVVLIGLSACNYKIVSADYGNEIAPPTTLPLQTQPTEAPTVPVDATEPQYITIDEAIAIALKDASFREADVTGLHGELERDDGKTIYDIDFYKDGKEYDYEIDAQTGAVLKPVKKADTTAADSSSGSSSSKTSTTSSSSSTQLTKDEAISKALSHAGLKKSQVSRLRAELDKDDGKTVYEVDFETADWEYEYEINAKTGKILKAEKDRND